MCQGVDLEAQFPDELGALIDWNASPVAGIRVGRGFLVPGAKHANLRVRPRSFPELRIRHHAMEG